MLDVGAGRGTVASRVCATQEGPDVWILEPARERARRAHYDHPELKALVGAAEGLPFPDAYFDKVYATLSLHHFHDVAAALREIARVTKAEGKFVVLDVDPRSFRGLFFRVVGRLTGERMHLMALDQLADAIGLVGGFEVTRTNTSGSFHFLQAVRL